MPVTRRACPICHHSLCLTEELPAQVKCAFCGASFLAPATPENTPPPRRQAYLVAAPFAPPPEPAGPQSPPWIRHVILGGGGLFVLLGLGLLVLCLTAEDPPSETAGPAPRTPPDTLAAPQKKEQQAAEETLANQQAKFAAGGETRDATGKDKSDAKIAGPGDPPLIVKVIETVTTEKVTRPRRLRLAVTPPQFDNMGALLKTLGAGYTYTPITEIDLRSSNRLADFDVVFFTCNRTPAHDRELEDSLRAFVQNGGTLYASDLRFAALVGAFPEFLAKVTAGGRTQDLTARVMDAGLREALGAEEIRLKFNAFNWKPACFDRAKVTTYLEGWYVTTSGKKAFAPLLVSFPCGKGTVIFTSFHNTAQNSETERKLLRYLVFTAVTAEVERRARTTLISGGFSPAAARRLVTSRAQPRVTHTYTHRKAGPLRFALGFPDQGATLRLTLTAPGGRTVEKEGNVTFVVEVADAPAGEWRYTVTAQDVPFPNFPFTLTVGAPSD